MIGDLEEINVVELFQMMNSSQKTGSVDLELIDNRATVLFNQGELVWARYGELSGKEAIFALLAKNSGQFAYSSGIPPEAEKFDVIGGFMGLIMEGLQRIDEMADMEPDQ
jgi:hypothetical protein